MGFISGVYDGILNRRMFFGTCKPFVLCQDAPSQTNKMVSREYDRWYDELMSFAADETQYFDDERGESREETVENLIAYFQSKAGAAEGLRTCIHNEKQLK